MNGYVFFNVFPSRNIFLSTRIKNSAKSFLYKVFSVKISLCENKIHHACKIKCVVVSVSNCHKNEKNLGPGTKVQKLTSHSSEI